MKRIILATILMIALSACGTSEERQLRKQKNDERESKADNYRLYEMDGDPTWKQDIKVYSVPVANGQLIITTLNSDSVHTVFIPTFSE